MNSKLKEEVSLFSLPPSLHKSNPYSPVHKILLMTTPAKQNMKTWVIPKKIRPFSLRISDLLNEIKINTKIVHHTILSKTAPWTIRQPTINLELAKLPKIKTHSITYQEKLIKIQNKFPDHYHIYTDGSKQGKKVGCAAISQKKETLKRLPNEASIYSAETTAIDLAMNIIANHKASKFIIYTDSKSVLLALQNRDTSSPLITKLLNKLNTLSKNNNIIFTWIPSHIGIQGNEKADKAAKKVLQIDMCKSKIPYTDLKPKRNLSHIQI